MNRNSDFLKWLLGMPLFCFAAGAAVVDGGAGADGAEEGGDQGGGEGAGGEGAAEEPAPWEETDEETPAEGDQEVDPDTGEPRVKAGKQPDAKATEAGVKKALAKLQEADAEGAKLLRKTFYTQEQAIRNFTRAFATPADAVSARELIDTVSIKDGDGNTISGEDAIPLVMQEAENYAGELMAMAKGDVAILDEMARDFPDGLAKLAPAAIDKMREINPAAFTRHQAQMGYSLLADKGGINALSRVLELIADGKQEAAFAKAKELSEWMNNLKQFTETKSSQQDDPARREIDERTQQLDRRERAQFIQQVAASVTGNLNSAIQPLINQYLRTAAKRNIRLTHQQKQAFFTGISSRVSGALERNAAYQKQFRSLMSKGDLKATTRYNASEIGKLVKRATRDEWLSRGFSTGTGKTATEEKGGTASRAAANVSAKPAASEIDWSKDRNRARYMRGEATLLKGGKVVKWDWDKV